MNEAFGERVKKIRQGRNWSQQELSLRAGISTPHISSIERGKRFPSLEYARRMADALGVGLVALCDTSVELRVPHMHNSSEELPLHLQNFILNEEAAPYLEAAQRMSTLPKAHSDLICLVIDLLLQSRTQILP